RQSPQTPQAFEVMNSKQIRQSFVDFFEERGHKHYPSAPLVPHGDPTLLFTNAGMVPFKDYFLGLDKPENRRAVSAQKCMRVSGKHNDLENVGPSPRHHTFFEMLGNFSFGDYFKAEAIEFGWDLVTRVWGLPAEHLTATIYEEDDEAAELWKKISGLPAARILRCGTKDNFWAMGETGPCGPCSEIFVDTRPDLPRVDWEVGSESGRYLEIWNLVFMQFERDDSGVMKPLPKPSIDTGAGLERVAAVLQGAQSNYDTDLFMPILQATASLAAGTYGRDPEDDVSYRVIADHLRAVAFLLADGVIPGNEGRGYVLRRILRRAVRHGMVLGFEEPFLNRLLPLVGEVMGHHYPELDRAQQASVATVSAEEEKFLSTIASASRQVQEAIDSVRHEGGSVLPGEAVFRFYDTYGLPLELIREIAEEEQLELDEEGFKVELERQRSRSREAVGEGQERLAAVREAVHADEQPKTVFLGYDARRVEGARVVSLARASERRYLPVEKLEQGEEGVVILERTPFYAEAGGEVGDRGSMRWDGGEALVVDTQKDPAGVSVHFVAVSAGSLDRGEAVTAEVDSGWRLPTQRNHTATHLLHRALRRVFGDTVHQAGSLVAPDRLRFDYTLHRPPTADEVSRVEDLVNRWILQAEPTVITPDRPQQEALDAGAMALFGEKYGETVRTVEVPGLELEDGGVVDSLELCGGCHVANTGEIGLFMITGERGIASGVRRIEALTGEGALDLVRRQRSFLQNVETELGVPADRAGGEIAALKGHRRDLEKDLARLRMQLVSGSEAAQEQEVDGVKVLVKEVPPAPVGELRSMADVLRQKLGSGVVVLGSREESKVTLIVAVTGDLEGRAHAGNLAREIAAMVGGSGGGRGDFAQAGGKAPDKLPEALNEVANLVRKQLQPAA
ncbi:MAG: alanine--tRNA ligase, partial [Thermoanaerobaculia bacterium]